jgi:hypothetical protein
VLDKTQKTNLIRLLRSQLSQHQLLLLFYNGLTDNYGYPKFYKLIKKYNMLGNMDDMELIYPADKDIYSGLPDVA